MTKDQLTLANQLHNHLESAMDFQSQLDYALSHYKDKEGLDWNLLFRAAIEEGILGQEIIGSMLRNLKTLTSAYAKVIEEELKAI